MTDSNNSSPADDDKFHETFEFKGIEVKPLSYARRALVLGLVNPSNLSFMDAPTFIYGCICPESELIRARRNIEAFDTKVAQWIESIKFGPQDSEEAASLISKLMTNSEANRAEPVADESMLPDPVGN